MSRDPVHIDGQDGAEGPRLLAVRGLWAATAGSTVEAFDWLIYALLVPYFSAQLIAPGTAGTGRAPVATSRAS